jgi:tetratricopeptide (TPR) repeat protein
MQEKEFERIYQSARTLFDEGKLDEAERLYQKLLEQNPRGFADVYNNLGLIYSEKGLLERAAQFFEKALELNPKYTEASLNLVITYNEMKRFDDAERVFTNAAEIVKTEAPSVDPFIQGKLANEHGKLGDAYYELGRYPEALEEYHKALRLRPDLVDILTKIGITLRDQGIFNEAIQYFERAKAINPSFSPAFIHLGLTYYYRREIKQATQEWKAVQKMDPSHRGVQAYLALINKP